MLRNTWDGSDGCGSKVLAIVLRRMLRPSFNTSSFGYWGKNSLTLHGKEETQVPFFAVKDLAKFSIGTGINLRNPNKLQRLCEHERSLPS